MKVEQITGANPVRAAEARPAARRLPLPAEAAQPVESPPQQTPAQPVTEGQISAHAWEAMEQANRRFAENKTQLTIEFDADLGRSIFKLVDTETGAVLRQVPSEQILAIARALAENCGPGAVFSADA